MAVGDRISQSLVNFVGQSIDLVFVSIMLLGVVFLASICRWDAVRLATLLDKDRAAFKLADAALRRPHDCRSPSLQRLQII